MLGSTYLAPRLISSFLEGSAFDRSDAPSAAMVSPPTDTDYCVAPHLIESACQGFQVNAGEMSLFGPILIGSGATVAEELIKIQDETDLDGFSLAYHITPGTFEDIVEYVVPELQERGRYKTEHTVGTLHHKMFGNGEHLPKRHIGAKLHT